MPIHGAVRTDLGRVRTQNEDSFGFFPDRSFYVVADGMGGYAGGEIASALAVETMLHSLIQTQQEDFTPLLDKDGRVYVGGRRLMMAVQQANAAVFQKSSQDPSLAGMGTTIAAVLFESHERLASICHVGDSRVYHIQHETIKQLTEDHSFVQQLFREGKLSAEEMKASPHRHMLTQAVGINPMVQPALGTAQLQVGDLIVLCSDGLHGLVKAEEILQIATSHASDLQQACDVLVSLANDRGGTDNCTVIVLRCDDVEDGDQTKEKSPLP
jgi:protein phosphatase